MNWVLLQEEKRDLVQQVKNKSLKSKINLEKYSRQLILREIGSEGQKRINKSKVLIIGLGGLGSSVLQYLSSAGVGVIGIVDHDQIQLSNMNRQVIYKNNDIGKNKVDIAEKFSKELNPSIKIEKYSTKVSEKNIEEIINEYDLISDCTDNIKTRILINDACFKLKKTWVMCSVSGFFGQLSTFKSYMKDSDGNFNPSYRHLMKNKILDEYNCENIGILGSIAGAMGSLQATELIKLIIGNGDNLINKILIFDFLSLQNKILKL